MSYLNLSFIFPYLCFLLRNHFLQGFLIFGVFFLLILLYL